MTKSGKTDHDTTLQELKDKVITFREDRGWAKHHTPKNLAINLIVEAAELLEHFTWDEYRQEDKQAVADELADVLFNLLNFADVYGIDIASSFLDKFARAEEKFPTELFNPTSDNGEAFFQIKKAYREGQDPNKT